MKEDVVQATSLLGGSPAEKDQRPGLRPSFRPANDSETEPTENRSVGLKTLRQFSISRDR